MSGGRWHAVIVEFEDGPGSALLHDVIHPASCDHGIVVRHVWDVHTGQQLSAMHVHEHYCDVQYEIDNAGYDFMPQEPGRYWVRAWNEVHPSGPWGPEEYDGGVHFEPMRKPKFEFENDDEVAR